MSHDVVAGRFHDTRADVVAGGAAARLILGHRSVAITELYAELDHRKAGEIISEVG